MHEPGSRDASGVAALALALSFPEPPASRWHRAGLGPRGERWLDAASVLLLLLLAVGWAWSIVDARRAAMMGDAPSQAVTPATGRIAAALTRRDAPTAAYVLDQLVRAVTPERGLSGKLRARIAEPGAPLVPGDSTLPGAVLFDERGDGDPAIAVAESLATDSVRVPDEPGVWSVMLAAGRAVREVADFSVITTRPLSERRGGRLGAYVVGTWPSERTTRRGYRTPTGLVEVTAANQDTPLSEHFTLRDFLTKGQADVWPKYLVVQTRLVDKLELVLAALERDGVRPDGVTVMSGFRTPEYNVRGGDPRGRATFSRHMYGDAADVFIDNDGDGRMDDLNGDGRVTVADAEVMAAAAREVERRQPALVGGVGVYPAGSGHGPFVHIDTRGYPARWRGEGN